MKFTFRINPLKKSYSKSEQEMLNYLKRVRLFAGLTEDERAEFIPFMYQRKFAKNEVIFFRDDPSQALYLVRRGAVSLFIDIDDKFEEITRLKSPEAFGTNALMRDSKRYFNANSVSDRCELYVIPSNNLQEIFEENVRIKAKIMYTLSKEYDVEMMRLFRAYKEVFGFFDLSRVFMSR